MKNGIVTIFTITMVIFSSCMILMQSDGSDAETDCKVTGYVGQLGNTGILATENVTIYIYDPTVTGSHSEGYSGKTNSEGYFSIALTVDESHLSKLCMYVDYQGYVIMAGPCVTPNGDVCNLDLTKASKSGSTYSISDSLSNCLVISTAKVAVTITVVGSEKVLKGVNIALYSGSVLTYSGETDDNGVYTVNKGKEIQTGEYRCVLKCDGYTQEEMTIDISIDHTSFTMQMEEKSIATYGGLTTYQILMIAGVAIGVMLVAISYALCKRNWAGMDDSEE